MKTSFYKSLFVLLGFVFVACSSGSDDGGGTTGGSGSLPAGDPVATSQVDSGGTIQLNAFSDFTCTNNWSNRDGALGLDAYSGSGVCRVSFPGTSGKYQMSLTIQTEYDGRPLYEVSINGSVVKAGLYPLSTPRGCDCPHETWYKECPDRNEIINVGTFIINAGDSIVFKGNDDYPCGKEHGAYAKWHRMTFTPVN